MREMSKFLEVLPVLFECTCVGITLAGTQAEIGVLATLASGLYNVGLTTMQAGTSIAGATSIRAQT